MKDPWNELAMLTKKAHVAWARHIQKNDLVIDATVGNGHDFLYLLQLLDHSGLAVGYDIQKEAIQKTQERVSGYSNYILKKQSHCLIEERGARLICYIAESV